MRDAVNAPLKHERVSAMGRQKTTPPTTPAATSPPAPPPATKEKLTKDAVIAIVKEMGEAAFETEKKGDEKDAYFLSQVKASAGFAKYDQGAMADGTLIQYISAGRSAAGYTRTRAASTGGTKTPKTLSADPEALQKASAQIRELIARKVTLDVVKDVSELLDTISLEQVTQLWGMLAMVNQFGGFEQFAKIFNTTGEDAKPTEPAKP